MSIIKYAISCGLITEKASQMDDIEEKFVVVLAEYDYMYKVFLPFFESEIGLRYKDALGYFLHDANREAANVEYAIDTNSFPERGKTSLVWVCFNRTKANIGLMKMILELWDER